MTMRQPWLTVLVVVSAQTAAMGGPQGAPPAARFDRARSYGEILVTCTGCHARAATAGAR